MTDSSGNEAKCAVLAGKTAKVPAATSRAVASANFSPMPSRAVPEIAPGRARGRCQEQQHRGDERSDAREEEGSGSGAEPRQAPGLLRGTLCRPRTRVNPPYRLGGGPSRRDLVPGRESPRRGDRDDEREQRRHGYHQPLQLVHALPPSRISHGAGSYLPLR